MWFARAGFPPGTRAKKTRFWRPTTRSGWAPFFWLLHTSQTLIAYPRLNNSRAGAYTLMNREKAEYYRQRAKECREAVAKTNDPTAKANWAEAETRWLALADKVTRKAPQK
jgi:hypothetical protein